MPPITDLPYIADIVHLMDNMHGFIVTVLNDCHGDLNAYREEYRTTTLRLSQEYTDLLRKIYDDSNEETEVAFPLATVPAPVQRPVDDNPTPATARIDFVERQYMGVPPWVSGALGSTNSEPTRSTDSDDTEH